MTLLHYLNAAVNQAMGLIRYPMVDSWKNRHTERDVMELTVAPPFHNHRTSRHSSPYWRIFHTKKRHQHTWKVGKVQQRDFPHKSLDIQSHMVGERACGNIFVNLCVRYQFDIFWGKYSNANKDDSSIKS